MSEEEERFYKWYNQDNRIALECVDCGQIENIEVWKEAEKRTADRCVYLIKEVYSLMLRDGYCEGCMDVEGSITAKASWHTIQKEFNLGGD